MEWNLATIHEQLAVALPDRECLIYQDRRLTWSEVTARTRRLANYLRGRGLGARSAPRAQLEGWQSGQDHIALYLHNCNEYLEGMLGAFKARIAPFNVNYRYVEGELLYLFKDAGARAIIYHACFAPLVAKLRAELLELAVLIQVADASGHALLPGAIEYEQALQESSPERPDLEWSGDDLYILYTGGTTGMPKGVLWRQHDIFVAALGGRARTSLDELIECAKDKPLRLLAAPPLMHGAAHWASFIVWNTGGTVVLQNNAQGLDAVDVLATAERERVHNLLIIGDAFAQPLLDQLDRRAYDLSELKLLTNSGAALHVRLKRALLERLPEVRIVDIVGSSEAGSQGLHISSRETGASTGVFAPAPRACVLDAELSRVLAPGDPNVGWLAQSGDVPLGYLGDRAKTERTFPVIDGVRYSVPGDRAQRRADGSIEFVGRDSVTINSGGEKIFAEEVEQALKQHPAVYDAVVCGRPSERWGQEVCAVVQLRAHSVADESALLEECAKHVARYKLPKLLQFVERIERSPSGKADYRWTAAMVARAGDQENAKGAMF